MMMLSKGDKIDLASIKAKLFHGSAEFTYARENGSSGRSAYAREKGNKGNSAFAGASKENDLAGL